MLQHLDLKQMLKIHTDATNTVLEYVIKMQLPAQTF